MGYEIKIIVGVKYGNYINDIAQVDLCKSIIRSTKLNDDAEETGFYSDCGEMITKDVYGEKLYANDIYTVLETIKAAHEEEYYRRYAIAIPMLESIIRDFQGSELRCILYGH